VPFVEWYHEVQAFPPNRLHPPFTSDPDIIFAEDTTVFV